MTMLTLSKYLFSGCTSTHLTTILFETERALNPNTLKRILVKNLDEEDNKRRATPGFNYSPAKKMHIQT